MNRSAWLYWPAVVVPAALAFVGAIGPVKLAVDRMAIETDQIAERLTERSAAAAVDAFVRRLSDSQGDYAIWDDAVRNLYGEVNADFVNENFVSSTESATFFDIAALLDARGNVLFAFRGGEPISGSFTAAMGPGLATLLVNLPNDGRTHEVAAGILKTAWGLEAVAAGPVVPQSEASPPPAGAARFLVVSQSLDAAAVERLGKDFVIDGLRIASAEAKGLPITDPNGNVLARLTWAAPTGGQQAQARVGPLVLGMIGVLGLTLLALVLIAVPALIRTEHLAREGKVQMERLGAAFSGVPHGLCMFDAESRLIYANARYRQMYDLPDDLVRPGTTLQTILGYRMRKGNAPVDFPNYVNHNGIDKTPGITDVFQFRLQDGRTIRLSHLNMAGGSYVATHEDVSASVQADERLRHLARYDGLTNLPNRMALRERLASAIEANEPKFAILCIDFDNFKFVNDSVGHAGGDAILVRAADRLRQCVGSKDFVARLMGDTFAVVQCGGDQPAAAAALAVKIMRKVGEPLEHEGKEVLVAASIGIALAPTNGRDADELIKNAELALYRAKQDARGRHVFFDISMDEKFKTRLDIELGLRHALERGEFVLHYQPIIDLKRGQVTGFEALLRWHHPERGWVPPAQFIPVAEDAGLISAIGEWVLRRACSDAAAWRRQLRVAVNLSTMQFKGDELVLTVVRALELAGLPADRLELEVTESVLLDNDEHTASVLHGLRDLGVRISLDDFGTGYSSLGYLRSFPFDKIKIDQSFVRDLPSNGAMAIVRAIVGLAADLGMTTTAEGVETPEQLAMLTQLGCVEVQGFYISTPLPLDELTSFLENAKRVRLVAA